MEGYIRRRPVARSAFNFLYLENFLFSFHLFLLVYITSAFLTNFVGETYVGLLFAGASALSAVFLYFISRVLIRFGNYKTLLILTATEFLTLIGLALSNEVVLVILLFLLHISLVITMHFSLDIFMEEYTRDEGTTGSKRGIFLTMQAVAILLGILTAGLILTDGDFWKVFLLASLILIPFFGIIVFKFSNFVDPEYHKFNLLPILSCMRQYKDLIHVTGAQIILRLFFSAIVIYVPVYLHEYIGFSWSQIGIILAISLLPYVFIEIPAGRLADKLLMEKTLLIAGFIILVISSAALSFVTGTSVILWTFLLLVLRVGASLVEIMTESYFFKHVDGDDSNTIALFRMARPVGYIIGPALGTVFLLFFPLNFVFLGLSVITLLGIYFSLNITDINRSSSTWNHGVSSEQSLSQKDIQ
jgi:MFS family permease